MKWVNTNTNARIHKAKMPNGAMNLVIFGMDGLEQANAKKIGFNPSKGGSFYFREGGIFNYKEIRSVFPNCVIVEVDEKEVFLVAYQKPPLSLESQGNDATPEKKVDIESKASRFIGINFDGQEVFEDHTYRRFIRAEDGTSVFNETQSPATYLRAKTVEDISLCADAFVRRLLQNQKLRFKDVVDFATVVFGKDGEVLAESDLRVRVIQEAIEESLFRTFGVEAAGYALDDKKRFDKAVSIEASQPGMQARTSSSVELQQYSTPLSVAYAVQAALVPFVKDDAKIMEPSIGTGSMVSLFRRNQVTGYEIDEDRTKLLQARNTHITVHHADFLKSQSNQNAYDVVLGNPPFGGLSTPVEMFDMKLTRLDHLFLMKALSQRKEIGAMSFIIASDNDSTKFADKAGQISGGSVNLFNWLADHYEMHAYEVDGSLYRKQGAGYNIRVVNVGRRFSDSQIEINRKTKAKRVSALPVVKDHDGLWAASRETMRFFQEKSGLVEVDRPEEPKLVAPANSFQSVYHPASKIGDGSSLIPSHLQVPLNKAFERLQDEVGNIDDFVATELGRSKEELARQFTPEQVDAIALAIWNINRGRGLILADETGQGKGRILSAIADWSSRKALDPMFITEKAGLFSSLWRDITDINADARIRPILMNKGANIIDMKNDGNVLFRAATESELKEVMDGDSDGTRLLMSTYSQFNRSPVKLQRADWLVNQRRGGTLILDEAHNAAGESNQGFNISSAVKNSGGVVWSSATFAKGAKNFGVYDKAFPPSVNLESLKETLEVGGEPLLEIMSAMLCEEGTMIRRESDISKLVIASVYPSKAQEESNIRLADALSEILQAMASLSGEMERVCTIKTRQMKKDFEEENKHLAQKPNAGSVGLSSLSFGSRLATINRQFILALAVPTAIEEATEAVRRGEKPIFAVEQTMETLLNDIAPESDDEDLLLVEDDVEPPPVMQFRDLLDRTLTRMMTVNENNGYGKSVKVDYFSLANDEDQRERMEADIKEVRDMIAAFPDLSASPVDDLIEAMQKLGLSVGEITGRQRRVVTQADGSKSIEDIPQVDRALIEHRFGSGVLDESPRDLRRLFGLSKVGKFLAG